MLLEHTNTDTSDFTRSRAAFDRSAWEVRSLRTFSKDEELFTKGKPATFFYVVRSGGFRTTQILADGRRQIDAFQLPGDVLGLEPGTTHRFTAESLCDSTLSIHRKADLPLLMADAGSGGTSLFEATLQELKRSQDHVSLLSQKTSIERVATFLSDISVRNGGVAKIFLPMSRLDIADYLGLTIETVSRSFTYLERKNIIHFACGRKYVVLKNDAALRELYAL